MNREDKIRPTLPFVQWKSIIKCLRNIAFYEYSRTAETCFLNILNSVKFETYCIYKIKLVEYVVLNVKFRTFSGKCSIGVRLQIPLHVPARLGHPLIPHPVVRNLRLSVRCCSQRRWTRWHMSWTAVAVLRPSAAEAAATPSSRRRRWQHLRSLLWSATRRIFTPCTSSSPEIVLSST